jgi:hypothetical protein
MNELRSCRNAGREGGKTIEEKEKTLQKKLKENFVLI